MCVTETGVLTGFDGQPANNIAMHTTVIIRQNNLAVIMEIH